MHKYVLFVSLLLSITACKPDKRAPIIKNGVFNVIDGSFETKNKKIDSISKVPFYPIVYVGDWKDVFKLSGFWNKNICVSESVETAYTPYSDSIYIFVDTTLKTSHRSIYHILNEWDYLSPSVDDVACFYMIIQNRSTLAISIGGYNALERFTREALDTTGTWKQIEYSHIQLGCINQCDVYLQPLQVAIVKVPRYSGQYFTACRLRTRGIDSLGNGCNIYSNVFYDYIDKRMLLDTLPDN